MAAMRMPSLSALEFSSHSRVVDLLVDRVDSFTDLDLILLSARSIIPSEFEFLQLSEARHVSCAISLLRETNGKRVTDYGLNTVDRISSVFGGGAA